MNDATYRKAKIVLLACVTCCVVILTFVVSAAVGRMSDNGRYVQWNYGASYSPDGKTHYLQDYVMDTHTGERALQK